MGKKRTDKGRMPGSLSGFLANAWHKLLRRSGRQRGGVFALCLMLMLSLPVCTAYAAIPDEHVLQLKITCKPDGATPTGMVFNLYYLAYSEDGGASYTLVEKFVDSKVDMPLLSSTDSEKGNAIRQLAAYINANKGTINPDASAETVDGTALITDLAPGYYLCASNTAYTLADGTRYTPVPFLFEMKRSSFVTGLDISSVSSVLSAATDSDPLEYAGVVKFAVTKITVTEDPTPTPNPEDPTPTVSPENTPTPTVSPENTPTPTVSPENTPTPTVSPENPSLTPSPENPSPSPGTPSLTPSPAPEVPRSSPTPAPTNPGETPTPGPENTPTPTVSPGNPTPTSSPENPTPSPENPSPTPSPAPGGGTTVRRGGSGGGGGATGGGLGGTPLTQITPDDVPAAGGGGGNDPDTTTLTDGDVPLSDEPTIDLLDDDVPLADIPEEDLLDLPEDPVPLAMMPQTGLLWWPVPIMLILGLFMAVTGWAKRRK